MIFLAHNSILRAAVHTLISSCRYIILAREWSLSWCLHYKLDERFIRQLDTWFPALVAVFRRDQILPRAWYISLRRFLPVDLSCKILQRCFLTATETQTGLIWVRATIIHRDACKVQNAGVVERSPGRPICHDVQFLGLPGLPLWARVPLADRLRLGAEYAGQLNVGIISFNVVCKSTVHLSRILRQVSSFSNGKSGRCHLGTERAYSSAPRSAWRLSKGLFAATHTTPGYGIEVSYLRRCHHSNDEILPMLPCYVVRVECSAIWKSLVIRRVHYRSNKPVRCRKKIYQIRFYR